MRWLGLLTLLLPGGAGLLWAADAKEPVEVPVKGFLVHEWGVFRVHDDVELANADARAEWDGLPKFVYGQTTMRDFPHRLEQLRPIYKPVIFLHAPKAMAVTVRVDFSRGVPAVWWPATWYPAHEAQAFQRVPATPEKPARHLVWRLELKQPLAVGGAPSERKPLGNAHWMQALRDVKCDEVYVALGDRTLAMEQEHFVYYDGLLRGVQALSISTEKGRATLKNEATFPVSDVWVVDRRDVEKARVGRLPRLDAGETKDVELPVMNEARWVGDAGKSLTAELKGAGLNEDEAASLTAIWSEGFFRGAGLTLLYRLPQEEYDRLLPLTVKPRPEKVVRVGLVQQVPVDQEMAERVARLVKQLDDDAFDKREAAQRELENLGRAAYAPLRRLQPTIFAPEPKRRLDEVLEKLDAERAIRK